MMGWTLSDKALKLAFKRAVNETHGANADELWKITEYICEHHTTGRVHSVEDTFKMLGGFFYELGSQVRSIQEALDTLEA